MERISDRGEILRSPSYAWALAQREAGRAVILMLICLACKSTVAVDFFIVESSARIACPGCGEELR